MKWPMVKLGDVVTLINGRAYKKHEMLREGKYPLMRVGNFFSNRDWYYSDLELPQKQYCDNGDLIYAWSASFGPQIWQGGKVIYHYHIWKLMVDESLADKKYLFYALKRDVDFIKAEQGSGSTMVHVTKTAMENRAIPLPPLEEQKRIAAILDKADGIRRKRQQAIKLADDFLRAVFLDMFGDPVTNPKGWEVRPLSSFVSKLGDGLHGTPKYDSEGDYYFINGNNLRNGAITISDKVKKVSEEEYKKHKKELNNSTMLVSINGTIGNVAFYRNEKIVLGKSACYFNVIESSISKIYLFYLIQSEYFLHYIRNIVTGSTIQNVSLKSMREFPVPIPNESLQKDFESKVESIQKLNGSIMGAEAEGTDLFLSLSQKAFSGEL